MKAIFNRLIRTYLENRIGKIQDYMVNPHEVQTQVFNYLVRKARRTQFGNRYGFSSIRTIHDFRKQVPIHSYEDLKGNILQMMEGQANVLWPGIIKWYSKSSGTTGDRSKFIPVSTDCLKNGHIKANWDVVTFLYDQRQDANIFAGKNLIICGSLSEYEKHAPTKFGDISAIMCHNMPSVGRPFYTPDFETALLDNFEEKLERMIQSVPQEDVVMFGGVPTWNLVLFQKILEYTGKSNMLEVWPNLQAYVHGGVGFEPYRKQFQALIPSEEFKYMEVYNASEGFFAIQNDCDEDGMLLLLDNGVYYEFIPLSEVGKPDPTVIGLHDVELGKQYALVISTNGGLWRYLIGDIILFTSVHPYKIKVTGRTKQFINAFGEEIIVDNTDRAIAKACQKHKAEVYEYTVGPIYLQTDAKGGHEWLIEFSHRPENLKSFAQDLDKNLRELNSDYDAKRFKGMALDNLKIVELPQGTFYKWMQQQGRLGPQVKIPRLANDRKFVDAILSFINSNP